MKFNEYDSVRICKDYNERVKKGDVGVVVMLFTMPNEAYEVEFLDENGYTKAVCTLQPDDLERL